MTVTADIARLNYTGNGVLVTFPFTWEIYTKNDLKVYVDDVLQVVDVDYTIAVASIEVPAGGNVVFDAGSIPAADTTVSLVLDLPLTQLVDYTEGDKFPAETHERALDRLIKINQSFSEVLKRVPKLPQSSALDLDMPTPTANSHIGWNAGATNLANIADPVITAATLYKVDALTTYGSGTVYTDVTLNAAISAVGAINTTTILLRPGTWVIAAAVTGTDNIYFELAPGAVIKPGLGITFTAYSPDNIIASYRQKIIDITNNTTNPIAFTVGGTVGSDWCGAGIENDGTTDETNEIDVLTNALNTVKGGVIKFGAKTYTGNFTIKSFVTFKGSAKSIQYQTATGTNGATHPAMTRLKAKATGAVVDTPVANQYNIVMQDLHIQGLGAATALIGIHWRDVDRSEIINVSFDNIADQGLLVDAGVVDRFEKIIAINCLLDTSQAAKIGVIDIAGTDHFISYIESTSSSAALSDANAYLCAFVMRGSTNYVQNLMSEISDVGVHVIGDFNAFFNCRADLNYGNGWEISATAAANRFLGCYSLRNSRETDNTYDGFEVAGVSNIFFACYAQSLAADGWYHKYGFSDSVSGGLRTNRNEYTGCFSSLAGTAEFNGVDALGSSYQIANTNYMIFADDDASPSVAGGTLFVEFSTGYTNPTTITDFEGGIPGQTIKVKSGSGSNITIDDGALIKTNTGADKAFGNNIVYTFTNINGVWYENE